MHLIARHIIFVSVALQRVVEVDKLHGLGVLHPTSEVEVLCAAVFLFLDHDLLNLQHNQIFYILLLPHQIQIRLMQLLQLHLSLLFQLLDV